MSRTTLTVLLLGALAALTVPSAAASAQDTTRRVQAESRGETELRSAERFGLGRPNYGFSPEQAIELQQALVRTGCNVGSPDGVVGERTLQGIQCFRDQKNLGAVGIEAVLTAMGVSFARPPQPPPTPEPPPPKLPIVLRPDSNYRPDVIARRDSIRRDSMQRDSVRRDSVRRDSARRDSTRRP